MHVRKKGIVGLLIINATWLNFLGPFLFNGYAEETTSQTSRESLPARAKTYVPSPSTSERSIREELKILNVEYTSSRGDVAIDKEKIRKNMWSVKGGVFSQQEIDEDIQTLFRLGDFDSVQILVTEMRGVKDERGICLEVVVSPAMKVSSISVVGKNEDSKANEKLSFDAERIMSLEVKGLTPEDGLVIVKKSLTKAGDMISDQRLNRDALVIEGFYKENGYKDVKVVTRVGPAKSGKADLVYEIREGARAILGYVVFIGNENIGTNELESVIKQKPSSRTGSIYFEESKLKTDIESLYVKYKDNGFLDVAIRSSIDVEVSKKADDENVPAFHYADGTTPEKRKKLLLTYLIEEGISYITRSIVITGSNYFSANELRTMMIEEAKKNLEKRKDEKNEHVHSEGLLIGKPFSPSRLEDSIDALKNIYGHKGYKDAKISYKIVGMSDKNAIEIQFDIEEGHKFVVDTIEVQGNYPSGSSARANIVRELDISPGDIIDTEAAKRSKEALLSTGLFSEVDIYYEETDRPDRVGLVVKTTDKPRDNPIAESLVEKAKAGDSKSQCWLGQCYLSGIGTKVDEEKASQWFLKASKQGDDLARDLLVQIDFNQNHQSYSSELVEKAESGDTRSQCSLAYCYYKGKGVTKDIKAALNWLEKSAGQGNPWAELELGYYYESLGSLANKQKAFGLFMSSARKGNSYARSTLRGKIGSYEITSDGANKYDQGIYTAEENACYAHYRDSEIKNSKQNISLSSQPKQNRAVTGKAVGTGEPALNIKANKIQFNTGESIINAEGSVFVVTSGKEFKFDMLRLDLITLKILNSSPKADVSYLPW